MDLNTIEIQIFVSCPRDVANEKAIVAKVCDRVNKNLISMECNVRLTFRDFSEIIGPTGARPQQLINDNIKGYDIYLGILHMRFGSDTGAVNPNTGKPYESGTEEEFVIASDTRHLVEGPGKIYFFFKKQTGSESTVDLEQARKVLAFKEGLMESNWVNSFDTTSEFNDLIMDLLTRVSFQLCIEQLNESKQSTIEDASSVETAISSMGNILSFIPIFPEVPNYIHRSISEPQKLDSFRFMLFQTETEKPVLRDLVVQEKRVILLGNAGSGKSVELQQTAKYFLNPSTPFISIYKRFNTYTNENIEDFLPEGWNKINPSIILLLLDGLDEIQPQHFNTAVRKLLDFSERNSKLRIVVSCRTNFYELPNETFSGTLTGFKVYILNDISIPEIKTYTANIPKLDWDNFIREVYNQSYLDLVQKPFFLDILIKYYIKRGNFSDGRSAIIEDSVLSMIDLDKEHFKTSIDIPKSKKPILNLLERVAFVMEVMGKNFITDEELETVLPIKEELNQIKHFSAFAKNPQRNLWMFEHNNIQEFLASKVLARQSFQKLIEIISFPPSYNKVKPTWINTISFFISTSEPLIRRKLIKWLVDKDPEIIIKFEPDRIDENLRIQIFKQVFDFYKEKNIWLSSNKFTNKEMSRFASFPETIDFLLYQIQDDSNSRIIKMNAIGLIDNFDLADFNTTYKAKVKEVLVNTLDKEESDNNMIHQLLYSLANLKITDLPTITHFVNKYSNRCNQYIRAGLYKLINSSDYLDQFVDFFLDGLNLSEMENAQNDRDTTNLFDESWQLKEGLSKMKSAVSLKKLLSNLKSREDRRRIDRHNNKEVVESILKNTFEAYKDNASLYKDIYDIYVTAGREYDKDYALMIIPFFEESRTKWSTFNSIWHDQVVKDFDKILLLELLLDENILTQFIKGYRSRDFNNQDAELMYRIIVGYSSSSNHNVELINYFEKEILELGGPKLEKPQFIDWATINKTKAQQSFDLLFKKEDMLKEIQSIFSEQGKDELTSDDLWELRKDSYKEIDDYFISSALELLRDFTTNNRTITYSEIEEWVINSPAFDDYQINEIYQVIHGNRNNWVNVHSQQVEFITAWCFRIGGNLDIKNAIKSNNDSTSVDRNSTRLWFFINHFNIILPESKMLEFTLYYDFQTSQNSDSSETIQKLEHFINKDTVEEKVANNLAIGISEVHVWVSNASYAIHNNVRNSFPNILRDLKNPNIREHHREQVLELYFKKTENYSAVQEILKTIGKDELRWKAVKFLINQEESRDFLLNYLKKIISNETELFESKMAAGKYLTQLNDMVGFKFITTHILENKDPAFDFHYRFETAIKNPEAIPILMKLMKLAKQPEFKKDFFNSLENYVLDTLYHIGIQSEHNFLLVKIAIENFINEHINDIENLNFLYFNVRKIEEQLYLNKSQAYTINDAITEYINLAN